jgi:hypothetical protein
MSRLPRIALIAALGLGAPVTAAAQDLLGAYFALLSPRDFYNSNGQRLSGFCQVLQQDRANYHRFGNRDDLDEWDPVFASVENRQRISTSCALDQGSDYIAGAVARGETRYVYVRIFGTGGTPTFVLAAEGAG